MPSTFSSELSNINKKKIKKKEKEKFFGRFFGEHYEAFFLSRQYFFLVNFFPHEYNYGSSSNLTTYEWAIHQELSKKKLSVFRKTNSLYAWLTDNLYLPPSFI